METHSLGKNYSGTRRIGGSEMDFFVFRDVDSDGHMSGGEAINGLRTALWTERYRDPGEFEFKAPVSTGLRDFLPVGSLISHVDTKEPQMVVSHEIDEDVKDREPDIVIKGVALDSYLKQRVVGDDIETYVFAGHRLYVAMDTFTLPFDTSWAQAVALIGYHLNTVFNIPQDNVSAFVPISNQQHIQPFPQPNQERKWGAVNLHQAILELLAVDDFGLKIVRPNAGNVDPTTTEFRVHNGSDKRDSVIFSHAFGDIVNPHYYWDDWALKTDYYCHSTYFRLRSDSGTVGFPRRVVDVDCTDMDGHLTDVQAADGSYTEGIGDAMDVRGQAVLRAMIGKSLLSTDISRTTNYVFRKDYDVGDIVTVNGNYDISADMRVTEYVEFQDENGENGYPTLSALNE